MTPGVLTASARSVDHSTGSDAEAIDARMGSPCPAMGAVEVVQKSVRENGLRKKKNEVSAISKARNRARRQGGDNWRWECRRSKRCCQKELQAVSFLVPVLANPRVTWIQNFSRLGGPPSPPPDF